MTTAAVTDPVSRARELDDAFRPAELLAHIAAVPADAWHPGQASFWKASALVGLEQYREAHDLLLAALKGEMSTIDRLRARALDARVLRRASPLVDDALGTALDVAQQAERLGGDAKTIAGDARIDAAHLFARKRCRDLAMREIRNATQSAPQARLLFAEGHVLASFDDRGTALQKFEATLASDGGTRLGHLGLAHVLSLAGEFDATAYHLDKLGELPPGDLYPRRLRYRLALSRSRWEEVVAILDEILKLSPNADPARADAYERSAALFRLGRRDDAAAGWRKLEATPPAPNDWFAKLGGRMARLATAEGAAQKPKKRLAAFPSVSQLRNHCGPASVELYMRFFGLQASQVEIARAIKFPDGGTPVYRMRRYLDGAGFETRRIEADLAQIKRLIDAGIPVIVEEDYSESRHVAVAIGYDDEREILEVQDPMSHDVRETFYEDWAKIRAYSNEGSVVGVPKTDAKLIAALDAAGAKECKYMSLVDEAWAAFDDKKFEDGDKKADESIALRKDYELAWTYRFHRARQDADKANTPQSRAKVRQIVDECVAIWPDDEWPQQLLGEVLYLEGRYKEALSAYERARDRDPQDASNWSMIADCHIAMRRNDDAYSALEQALRRNPAHRRANENQAHMAWMRGEDRFAWTLNECARELAPGNPFNHGIHASLLAALGQLAEAVAAYDRALKIDPSRTGYEIERAKLLARDNKVDEGAGSLRKLIEQRPKEIGLMIELADLLYNNNRAGQAVKVCQDMLAIDANVAAAHAIMGAAMCARGELDEGLAEMKQALSRRPTYAWVYSEMGRFLSQAGKHVEAIEAFAASLGLAGGPVKSYDLGDALARAGFADDAVYHMRQAAWGAGQSETRYDRIAQVINQSQGPYAASDLLRDLAEKRPDDRGLLRAHAKLLLEYLSAPGLAAPVMKRLVALAPDDPFALAWRGANAFDAGQPSEGEGEKLLLAAIAAAPRQAYPRRVLAQRLNARGRFAEAHQHLAPLNDDYATTLERVVAQIGQDKIADAEKTIAAFGSSRDTPDRPNAGVRIMQFKIAWRKRDMTAALALVEQLSRLYNESEDDGRLDEWEEEKFECLCRLNQPDRALAFGEKQATDAPSLAQLAYVAIGANQAKLAAELATRALHMDPAQSTALYVVGQLQELDGLADKAIETWERVRTLTDWHVGPENIARVLLGTGTGAGDPKAALALAEQAIKAPMGHTCFVAAGVRAQAKLLTGDRDGAKIDLERAWSLARLDFRDFTYHDLWAIRAALAGDAAGAEIQWREWERDAGVSPADKARVERVKAVLK
jgi:predicted Zn-dependent protease